MQLANEIMKSASVQKHKDLHVLDARYQGLGMKEMSPLDRTSTEYTQISHYLNNSVGGTHHIRYTVQDVFRIERNGEFDRLDKSPYANLGPKSDRRLLWHGSRASNFGGILSQGLRIAPPEAPVSGYMFGKGVYLADMSSKSAGYCAAGISGGTGILLLCEAELGAPMLELTDSDYNAGDRCKDNDCLATWGQGEIAPQAWKDAACIHPDLKGVKMPDVVTKPPAATNVPDAYLM
jgi:poly [ADP-ribose] polymerase